MTKMTILASLFTIFFLTISCMSAEERQVRVAWDLLDTQVNSHSSILEMTTVSTKEYLDSISTAYQFYGYTGEEYESDYLLQELYNGETHYFITVTSEELDSVVIVGDSATFFFMNQGNSYSNLLINENGEWKVELYEAIRNSRIVSYDNEQSWDAFVNQEHWNPIVIHNELGQVNTEDGERQVCITEMYWKAVATPNDSLEVEENEWICLELNVPLNPGESHSIFLEESDAFIDLKIIDDLGYIHEYQNLSYTKQGVSKTVTPKLLIVTNGLQDKSIQYLLTRPSSEYEWRSIGFGSSILYPGETWSVISQEGQTHSVRVILEDGIQTYTVNEVTINGDNINNGNTYLTITESDRDPILGESVDNPVPIGEWATDLQSFDTQNFQIRVADVQRGGGALRTIQNENRFFSPENGFEYLILKIEVYYPNNGINEGSIDFSMYGRDLYYNGQLIDDELNLVLYPRFGEISLLPGGITWGYIYYEIPVGWGTPLLMLGANMFSGEGGIFFSLR